MKCPHCGYHHGWDSETLKDIEGDEGEFYRLPIKLERQYYRQKDEINLCGCPSCKKTFIY